MSKIAIAKAFGYLTEMVWGMVEWFYTDSENSNKRIISKISIKSPDSKSIDRIECVANNFDHIEITLMGKNGGLSDYKILIPISRLCQQEVQKRLISSRGLPFMTSATVVSNDEIELDILSYIKNYAGRNGDFNWSLGISPLKVSWVIPDHCRENFQCLVIGWSNGEVSVYDDINNSINYESIVNE